MKVDFMDDELLIGFFLSAMESALDKKQGVADFTGICAMIGVDEKRLEDCLRRNFGASGAEITKVFSLNIPLFML